RPAGCVLVAGGNGCCVLPRRCGGVSSSCARCHRWPRSWWLGELWWWVTLDGGPRRPVRSPGRARVGGLAVTAMGSAAEPPAAGAFCDARRRLLHQARVAGLAAPVVV